MTLAIDCQPIKVPSLHDWVAVPSFDDAYGRLNLLILDKFKVPFYICPKLLEMSYRTIDTVRHCFWGTQDRLSFKSLVN